MNKHNEILLKTGTQNLSLIFLRSNICITNFVSITSTMSLCYVNGKHNRTFEGFCVFFVVSTCMNCKCTRCTYSFFFFF